VDIATIIGIILGSGMILGSILLGGSLGDFIDVPSIGIVGGGALSALLIAFPLKQVLAAFSIAKQTFFVRVPDLREELKRFSELAGIARRDGLLGLESRMADVKDPFLKRGMEMVIDNSPVEKVQEVLSTELACIQNRHSLGKKVFEQLGALLPAMGMVGTLIGLIQMLTKLDDPSKIGAGMAVAMITTFYGALGSNLFALPMANKLDLRSKEESNVREMMIAGFCALLEGDGPRAVETKLSVFLAPKVRESQPQAA
jgi:chemotaxis protein MotA